MKLTTTLLIAGLFLVTATAATAGEAEATQAALAVEAPSATLQPFGVDAVVAPGANCGDAPDALTSVDGQEPIPTVGTCGSCSTDGCAGAPRGQICALPWGGWGNCNIYSGGYRCSTGGWECQCGSGGLP